MTPRITFITILCVLGISLGQLLFKKAAQALPVAASWEHWVFNIWLATALVLYAGTTLAWVWVLRHAPLHLAYPFMGLAFLIVPLSAALWLGEPLRWQTLAGGLLIVVGVWLTASEG